MKDLKWSNKADIIEIIDNELLRNPEKAELIYKKIHDYEAMANNGFSKPMRCSIDDIVAYLESM